MHQESEASFVLFEVIINGIMHRGNVTAKTIADGGVRQKDHQEEQARKSEPFSLTLSHSIVKHRYQVFGLFRFCNNTTSAHNAPDRPNWYLTMAYAITVVFLNNIDAKCDIKYYVINYIVFIEKN